MTAGAGAAHSRNLLALWARAAYRLDVLGVDRVPTTGPLLLLRADAGIAHGLLVQAAAPRPVHVALPAADWLPPWDRLLAPAGWLPLALGRPDRAGLHAALDLLAAGGAVCVPDGAGAGPMVAYLVVRSGAPVVPVTVVTGSAPRRERSPVPNPAARRRRVTVGFGRPITVPSPDRPWRRAALDRVGEQVRQAVSDARSDTRRRAAGPAGDGSPGGHRGAVRSPVCRGGEG